MNNKPAYNSMLPGPSAIPSAAGEPIILDAWIVSPPPSRLKRYLAGLTGFGISLVVHLTLLVVIGSITWVIINRTPPEREVGIVVGEEGGGGTLAKNEAGIAAIAGGDAELKTALPNAPALDQTSDTGETVASPSGPKIDLQATADGESGGKSASAKGLEIGEPGGSGGGAGGGKGGLASFLGASARANRVCYVLDYSGSMQDEDPGVAPGDTRFKHLLRELEKSINLLKPPQKFFIIFYDNKFETMPAKDMVTATPDNKIKFIEWARQVNGGGGTLPVPAMVEAIKLKPHVIWFMTDGEFEAAVADMIRQANKQIARGAVQITTFAFHSEEGKAILQKIAAENHGDYRYVPPPRGGKP